MFQKELPSKYKYSYKSNLTIKEIKFIVKILNSFRNFKIL